MTQIQVAAASGVPYSTLRAIERAHVQEPSFFAVMDICGVIGLKASKLEALFGARLDQRPPPTDASRTSRPGAIQEGEPTVR